MTKRRNTDATTDAMQPGQCLASMARLQLSSAQRPLSASIRQVALPLALASQVRYASGKPTKKSSPAHHKKAEKKKKLPKQFKHFNAADHPQFSICDALRYAHAPVLPCRSSNAVLLTT